ncbi:MAG: ribosome biogenesis GTPase Der [Planctomycetota bacterium]|nr:ribosome biogenesis GTPase Der [Planctomycetota bacterium]
MAGLPCIAIVGRPNVGKSTLANRMCRSRVSIVEPTEGVTRDRVAIRTKLDTPWGERPVEVIDTGGIGIVDRDDLGPVVEEQVRVALESADLVVFLVDARSGPTPLDRTVADRLRGLEKPVLLVCNKVECGEQEWEVDAFRALGMGAELFSISAQNGVGLAPLYERIAELLPPFETGDEPDPPPALKLAVVGRRNAGKSTLVNAIAGEERMIVSEIPGTTRDAVDVVVERDGETLVLIDTAGVRKRSRIADAVEFFSDARSYKAIRRADVVLLLFDARQPLAGIEKRLARYVRDHHKCVVLGANKWDLVDGVEVTEYERYLDRELPGLAWAPRSFLSAKTGLNVAATVDLCRDLMRQASLRVGTGELNRVLERALEARSPSARGYRVRVRYGTQAGVRPPTFVFFVNDRNLIGRDYLRYLENRLRAELPLDHVPIRIVLRDREPRDSE